MADQFELVSPFKPTGDQPQAIDRLVEGLKEGKKEQGWKVLPEPARPSRWQM